MILNQLKKFSLPVFALFVLLNACTEPYDITLDETYTRLVVDGTISSDTSAKWVRLTTSTSYFYNQEPPAISEAIVYLDDGIQKIQLTEDSQKPGFYGTPEDYFGIPGSTYSLEINLKEKIGEKDKFTAETLMPNTEYTVDSIVLSYEAGFDFYLIELYALDPPTKDYYKFDALINGKIITDTASRSLVTDDLFYNGNNTNGLGVMFLRSNEVIPGDTITLLMAAISEDYYNFFNELRTESGGSNPIFSGPPANIRSNIQEGGLGYFSASKSLEISIIVPENPKEMKRLK
ncbi:MAG: DUF4249 domain-containing protein [Ignavibacteria bacterium]|nr:DUF4249 domain-containing protein [Ignavibacteria bacterium]